MKKILLTGSEGFIGSHLLEALVIEGFKVKALVQYNSFSNKGWIEYIDSKIYKEADNHFIYTGCQILNKKLFKSFSIENFSISKVWDDLIKLEKLNGLESQKKFYHLTNLEIFKKLQDF